MKKMLRKILPPLLGVAFMAPSAASAQSIYMNDDLSGASAPSTLAGFWLGAHRGTHPENWAVWETDPDGTTANVSYWVDGGSMERTWDDSGSDQWGGAIPTHEAPLVFSFRFYDFGTETGEEREGEPLVYCELQATSVTPLFSAGIAAASWFNPSLGGDPATFDETRYQARMYPTPASSSVGNWFQLTTERSVGWHTFTFVIRPDTFDIYVDDELDRGNLLWRTAAGTAPAFDRIRTGGGFSQVGSPALFDDIYLATDPAFARDLIIDEHPQRTYAHLGEEVSFSVAASASGALTYQWMKDDGPLSDDGRITGTDTTTLTISNSTPADNGIYTVVVTSPGESLESSTASLYITEAGEYIVNGGALWDDVTVVGAWNTSDTAGWFGYRWVGMTEDTVPERTVTFPNPVSEAGFYDLYTWYVPSAPGGNRPTEAPYHIQHADGDEWVFMNQQTPNGSKWELLAEAVRFEVGAGQVVISNHIQEGRTGGGALMADAVRWVKVEPGSDVAPVLSIARGAAGDVELMIVGTPETEYTAEWVENLGDEWQVLGTEMTDLSGAAIFVDAAVTDTASRRFYRVTAP